MNVITLENVSKTYRHYAHPWDRLREVITRRPGYSAFTALEPLNLAIARGDVLGVIGCNGAGKSTLLKILAGTLQPSTGRVQTNAKIAALLELGAGFHPEMTGRENVYLGGSVQGLSKALIDLKYEEIVAFSGLAAAMDRPLKTYSTGMSARLAFAVAMAVDPDILILDETLSVGDGAFARKSFDRIIDFQRSGRTLLFCSHSMYQVEAICSRVLWLNQGRIERDGSPAEVIGAYNEFLAQQRFEADQPLKNPSLPASGGTSLVRLIRIEANSEPKTQPPLTLESEKSSLSLRILFQGVQDQPPPSLGVTLMGPGGAPLASASSLEDGLKLPRSEDDRYEVTLHFPALPLLRGRYRVNVYLLCEEGLHVYESALGAAEFDVTQRTREVGLIRLQRSWSNHQTV